MQTPYLPRKIFGDDFEKVYEPAEDSFLLLDALELDLEFLRNNTTTCLEIGSGSGVIVTALAQVFNKDKTLPCPSRLILATDLNWNACMTTRKCATYHQQDSSIQVIRTDLAESLVDRLQNSVDLLIFNPPYVPTDTSETEPHRSGTEATDKTIQSNEHNQLHLSWAGGHDGRSVTNIFLDNYVPKLLSKPSGVAYMIVLEQNKPSELLDYLKVTHSIGGKIVMERQAGIEHLYVVKYEWLI